MKKPSVNVAGIKKSLVTHGEKVMFGGAFLVLMLFGYSALTREKLPSDMEPLQLRDKIDTATGKVKDGMPELPPIVLAEKDFTKVNAMTVTPDGPYIDAVVIIPPPPSNALREDPQILGIEELRVGAGRGIFTAAAAQGAQKPPAGAAKRAAGATVEGKFWAVITALVPLDKQEKEYQRALGDAIEVTGRKSDADEVSYLNHYIVERAEVSGEGTENLKWEPLFVQSELEKAKAWSTEVVDEKYVHETLTMSLPPVDMKWDDSVAHVPTIPLATKAVEATEEAGDATEDKEVQPRNFDNFDDQQPKDVEAATTSDEVEAPVRLFRYFDFTAEPGKQYRYRVRIAVHNPNYDVELKFLKNKDSRSKKWLASSWSEPTPVVTIPYREQIFAGTIDKANKPNEPNITTVVTQLNEQGGYEAFGKSEVTRGSPVVARGAQYLDPSTRQLQNVNTPIVTGALVVDVDGGEQLPAVGKEKLLEPLSVLILSKQGLLEVHNEMDDAVTVQSKDLSAAAAPAARRMREREEPSDEEPGILGGRNAKEKRQPSRRAREEPSSD